MLIYLNKSLNQVFALLEIIALKAWKQKRLHDLGSLFLFKFIQIKTFGNLVIAQSANQPPYKGGLNYTKQYSKEQRY